MASASEAVTRPATAAVVCGRVETGGVRPAVDAPESVRDGAWPETSAAVARALPDRAPLPVRAVLARRELTPQYRASVASSSAISGRLNSTKKKPHIPASSA